MEVSQTSSVFDLESTRQLEEYKAVLLRLYNAAEYRIHHGYPQIDDYTVMSESERTLHRVQEALDKRV